MRNKYDISLTSAFTVADPASCSERELFAYVSQYEALLSCLERHRGPEGLDKRISEALHLVLHELEDRGCFVELDTGSSNASLNAARHEFKVFGGCM